MRALLSTACGGPETLELRELPDPVPGAGEVLVRVTSCGVNYPDVLVIEDRYQARPERPFAPGGEVAGFVEAVGEGVERVRPGDRIAALTFLGGMVEKMVLPADRLQPLPDDVPGPEGAMLLTTYATSYHALVDRGAIAAGETVLVLGAAGGVGLAAVEIARALGARVVAAVSSEAKAGAGREAGADEVLVYGTAPLDRDGQRAFGERLKEALGKGGADIVYDPVGGTLAEPALRATGWRGRYLVVGFTGGIPSIPLNLTLLKGSAVVGVFMGAFAEREPEKARGNIEALFQLHRQGLLKPRVSASYPLERGGEAIARLGAREVVGKVIVTIGEA